jgi:hypothetical protein
MSVMTAGEQKRRAGSARGRRLVTAVPGQSNVMAGPWPGAGEWHGRKAPGERHGRTAHGAPGRASRPVRTRVRLTRRGRIVVAGLITASVVLVAALAWLAGTAKADAAGSGVPSSAVYHSLHSVVVLPGQSLWSIATRYEPGSDPRNVIQEIIDLNALSGTSVQPGQHLWLPRR